jgi:hypothetical protein
LSLFASACHYLTNTHDIHYIYVMIEPLTYTTDHAGARTKWRDSIPQLYTDLRAQGYTHSDIVAGWGISDNTLAIWTARSPALAHAINNAPDAPATHNPKPEPYSQESLRRMANQALHDLLARMVTAPDDYKPNEIITAAREALDRTDGKPIQSSIVTGGLAHTYTLSDDDRDIIRAYTQAKAAPVIEGAGSTPCIPFREEKI